EVQATTASLDFTSGSFVDRVQLGNGTLAPLQGPIGIRGTPRGNVNVTLDNTADGQPRDVVINAQSVVGFGAAPVTLIAGVGNPALNGLIIRSGRAGTAYSIVDTPALFTLQLTGQGQDVVQAAGTHQRLDVGGARAVTLGAPNAALGRFGGEVHIGSGASTALTIDDRASTGTRQGHTDTSQLGGLAPFPIVYSAATLHALSVLFG